MGSIREAINYSRLGRFVNFSKLGEWFKDTDLSLACETALRKTYQGRGRISQLLMTLSLPVHFPISSTIIYTHIKSLSKSSMEYGKLRIDAKNYFADSNNLSFLNCMP